MAALYASPRAEIFDDRIRAPIPKPEPWPPVSR